MLKGELVLTVKLTKREEVPVEKTWKLEDLFATEADWEAELKAVEEDIRRILQYKGKLAEGADTFFACLNDYEAYVIRVMKMATYASLRQSEDGSNPKNQGNMSRVAAAMAKINAELAFIESELLALPEGTIEGYLQEKPEMSSLKNYLFDLLATKPHKLSPETEQVLASFGEVFGAPYTIYLRGKSSDMVFEPITTQSEGDLPVSFALYEDKYEISPNTEVRRKAFASFVKTLDQYKNTFAAAYATEVKKQVVQARVRKYESVTDMLLEPHKVTQEMYHNLLDIILTELAPHMRRFAKLKQRVLGLDEMKFCDLKAPLDADFNPSITIEQARDMILEALQVMGPEYAEIMGRAFEERWIDLPENIGKSTGAFCSSPYGAHPYILITWTDTMRGTFVLAHELGHAGHFYLAGKNQRMLNVRPSMYFVEAPSTLNELILGNHILSKSNDPRMKRWVILQMLGTYYHNFVTHLLEGELQRRIYAIAESGKPITALTLCEQKAEVLRNFWGDVVEIDHGASLTWMRQPHYYMGLYPYTYSAGLTVSTAVAQMIREEGQPAVDRWLDVLKSGGIYPPLELIKKAGVDMSTPEPIRNAVAYVGSLIDQLEQLFNENV